MSLLNGAGQILVLPPSPALASRVLFYVTRNATPSGAAEWSTAFPANMYAGLTIVHGGHLHRESAEALPVIGLSGALTRATALHYLEGPRTTVAVFKPGALSDVVRLPTVEFTDRWIDADKLFTRAQYAELSDRVQHQPNVARRIHALEDFLLRRFRAARGAAHEISQAMHSLVWDLPHLSIDQLADRFGTSKRGLQRKFRDVFGLSPRMLARLARLQLTLVYLQRRSHRLVDIAHLAGFADAAHLAREVRAFMACTPSSINKAMKEPAALSWALAAQQDAVNPRAVHVDVET